MKRWVVDLKEGRLFLAVLQAETRPEYVADREVGVVYVRAVDELGAWVRAGQLLEQENNNEVP